MKRHFLAAACAVLSLGTAPGCSDACVLGESRCKGDEIYECGLSGVLSDRHDFIGTSGGCLPGQCLDLPRDEGEREALCSATGLVDPRCAAREGMICADEHTALLCQLGFSSREEACGGRCVADGAFCSVDTAPSAVCAEFARQGNACEGAESAVICFEGYVVARIPCLGQSARCVRADANALCVVDTPCEGPDETRCEGVSTLTGCVHNQVVATVCPDKTACHQYSSLSGEPVAYCERP